MTKNDLKLFDLYGLTRVEYDQMIIRFKVVGFRMFDPFRPKERA